jgi:hypothetical protein
MELNLVFDPSLEVLEFEKNELNQKLNGLEI